ncbi:MarR family winged helix-turn-helix transcriptional regulator [Rhodovarius lipocyclicus]|uniref:MarR family winged helix-turn-helix transcriptional regulator n=1 Tax=Rhodovarius lipocyclicus TaxID=268410 RepID=UPI001F1D40A8|nr:helix-turn-helix domain-containing protein [Rhodovarius lipocyclicus]
MPDPIPQIRAASRRLVRELGFLNPTLAGTQLPPSAVHALIEIGAHPGLTARQLSETLLLEKSSVSRMLRKLVAAGEVAEGSNPADARAKPLSLTAQGQATLARIDSFARHQVATALARMPEPARAQLAGALAAYAAALRACRLEEPPA